jgi:predicted DNA-binding transcriptional regulator AlpA
VANLQTVWGVGRLVSDDCAAMDQGAEKPPITILGKPSVLARVGFSDTTLWRQVRKGKFPRPIQLSPGRVGWLSQEVEAWLAARAAERA